MCFSGDSPAGMKTFGVAERSFLMGLRAGVGGDVDGEESVEPGGVRDGVDGAGDGISGAKSIKSTEMEGFVGWRAGGVGGDIVAISPAFAATISRFVSWVSDSEAELADSSEASEAPAEPPLSHSTVEVFMAETIAGLVSSLTAFLSRYQRGTSPPIPIFSRVALSGISCLKRQPCCA